MNSLDINIRFAVKVKGNDKLSFRINFSVFRGESHIDFLTQCIIMIQTR